MQRFVNFNLLNVNKNHLTGWFSISWKGHGITKDIPRSYQVQYRPVCTWTSSGDGNNLLTIYDLRITIKNLRFTCDELRLKIDDLRVTSDK